MGTWQQMAPGIGTARTASHRLIFLQQSESFLAQGKVIDGTKSRDPGNTDIGVLRSGLLMGKITSSGYYAPSIIGTSTGAYTSGATSITIGAAEAVELVRRVGSSGTGYVIGPPSAAGTVAKTALTYSAVNTTTGVLTITDLGVNKIAGSWITADDGSETMLSFIPDAVGYGIVVTDQDGNSVSYVDYPKLPVAGIVDASQLINWPSDTSLRQWIVDKLANSNAGGKYVFDHAF